MPTFEFGEQVIRTEQAYQQQLDYLKLSLSEMTKIMEDDPFHQGCWVVVEDCAEADYKSEPFPLFLLPFRIYNPLSKALEYYKPAENRIRDNGIVRKILAYQIGGNTQVLTIDLEKESELEKEVRNPEPVGAL